MFSQLNLLILLTNLYPFHWMEDSFVSLAVEVIMGIDICNILFDIKVKVIILQLLFLFYFVIA